MFKAGFGYSITKKRSIDLSSADLSMAEAILEDVPSLRQCIGCGSCSATCSAAEFTEFNFRRLHHLIRRGEVADAKTEISKCMLCGKCSLSCPRGVNTRGVVVSIMKHIK